jgi:peptidyl-prolyl cis-trans isomerase SurA
MMLCRIRFQAMLAPILLMGIFLFGYPSFAQDASQASSTTTDAKTRNLNGVAAVVNTGYISRKDIDDRIAELQKEGVKLPDASVLRKSILDRLIIEKIQVQNATELGVTVTDKELDKIISDMAAKNKLTLAEFKEKAGSTTGSFAKYREMLRENILVTRYREHEVDAKITISEAEIDNFIAERNRALAEPPPQPSRPAAKGELEEIDIAQIFIPADPADGPKAQADAKKQADALLREGRGKADFLQMGAAAAKENPKIKFQEMGYRTPDRIPQLFNEAIKNVPSGQLPSAVVKSPAGYHVLKVLDRRAAVTVAPQSQQASAATVTTTPKNIMITQTLSRHILIRQRPGLAAQDAERRLAGYRDQVRAKTADFGELAKKYSEDGSAKNGGELGWMGPGDLVPEFEQVMNRLQVGEVSNPVKTQFGWHIIQVLERRETELTVDKQREFAKAAIRSKKMDQAYEDWLNELRDTATVKILNVNDAAKSSR